ncbi:MAG TPA: DUF4118 domain-containing protein [Actinomycetes bacterium]|nr:DUF4118 domain-containing protein [Actinomycetes bacterium]
MRRLLGVQGEGVVWGAGGFAASLVVGALIEPYRATIGLENVVIAYLGVVVVTAAVGGRTAGLISALSAALAYTFFFTTPYRALTIDSAEQAITVALLFLAGLLASIGSRPSSRPVEADPRQAEAIWLLDSITRTVAMGGDADQLAAQGVRDLLDARRVEVRRTADADHDKVTAEAGEPAGEPDPRGLVRLEEDGRIPSGHLRHVGAGLVLPEEGVILDIEWAGQLVGALVVLPGRDRAVTRPVRVALAAVANALALYGPARPA